MEPNNTLLADRTADNMAEASAAEVLDLLFDNNDGVLQNQQQITPEPENLAAANTMPSLDLVSWVYLRVNYRIQVFTHESI